MKAKLAYDRGTLLLTGGWGAPYTVWDHRVKAFRAPAYRYRDIAEYFERSRIPFEDHVLSPLPMDKAPVGRFKLRDFQERAVEAWFRAGGRGVVVLPPGSGKTVIAAEVIRRLCKPTLVVVPTLPLLDQWRSMISRLLGIEAGALGGGRHELRGITVSTYDSAYLRAEELGDRFELAVFDECHHLAAEGYSQIGEMLAAPYRLGLTATFEREDGRHILLFSLIGGIVFRMGPGELAGKHLAEFEVVRVPVKLTEEEKLEYEKCMREYKSYLEKAGLRIRDIDDFRKLIMRSGVSLPARRALLAWNEARKIALNSRAKIEALKEILEAHRQDKVLIFTEYNEMAELISRELLIPLITHRTRREEREELLSGFKEGRYTKIVTSKVLDEGVDVPDARVAVIVGGSGSRREFIQRLGRVLRKSGVKVALLYEIVSKGTVETRVSSRRRRALREV